MAQRDLFFDRVRVAMADSIRHGVAVLSDPHVNLTAMATEGWEDVQPSTQLSIRASIRDRNQMLRAFWDRYATAYPTAHEGCARLLVNPPDGLQYIGAETWTMRSPGSPLTGRYGTEISVTPTGLQMAGIRGEVRGFFDEVVIFWDGGLNVAALVERMVTGTVVTCARPKLNRHGFWLAWTGIDLTFSAIFEEMDRHYKVASIGVEGTADVELSAFGLESR